MNASRKPKRPEPTNSQTPIVCPGEDSEDNARVMVSSLNEDWFVRLDIGGGDGAYYQPSQARALGFALLTAADAAMGAKRLVDLVMAYDPSRVTHPGETLADLLVERKMTQADLARVMCRPKKTINEIIKGKASITADTARGLEIALDVPAAFWLRRQSDFDAKA